MRSASPLFHRTSSPDKCSQGLRLRQNHSSSFAVAGGRAGTHLRVPDLHSMPREPHSLAAAQEPEDGRLQDPPITQSPVGKLGDWAPPAPRTSVPCDLWGLTGRSGREQGGLNHRVRSTCCVQTIPVLTSCYPHTCGTHQPVSSNNGS